MKVFHIIQDQAGCRIDKALRELLPSLPVSAMQKYLRLGRIKLNNRKAKPDTRLQAGDEIHCHLFDHQLGLEARTQTDLLSQPDPQLIKKNILPLYEDEDLLIVNKPAGIAVQGGSKQNKGESMDELASAFSGKPVKLLHRLDQPTSGILIFGKNALSARTLAEDFKTGRIQKVYQAICLNRPPQKHGKIDFSLQRKAFSDPEKKMGPGHDLEALTEYKILQLKAGLSLLELRPLTGRTHQIRVHLSLINCPVLGDERYSDTSFKRLCLHAWQCTFMHPRTRETLLVEAPSPLISIWEQLPKGL